MTINRSILGVIFFLTGVLASGQSFIEDSKDYIHPFSDVKSNVLLNHIDGLSDSIRIVGLGEVSHYTKECYDLKHSIINKLIEKGFRGLVLEVDFGQGLLWNDYVVNGEGNIDELVSKCPWFTYRTKEFKDLLLDIRNYNASAQQKPFQIFGMEMTYIAQNLTWLTDYFKNHLADKNSLIEAINESTNTLVFNQHSSKEVVAYWNLYYSIREVLESNSERLISNGGQDKFNIALQINQIIRQYVTCVAQEDFSLLVEFRDQYSSRNVSWVLNQLGEDSKIAIWAHNGHITKETVMFNYNILGHYMNRWFGDSYYAIGFTFNEGEFGAHSSEGFRQKLPVISVPSLTMDLDSYNSAYVLFDIRSNLNNNILMPDSPLNSEMPIRRDISENFPPNYEPIMNIDLKNSYDCLIYIDKTNMPNTID